MTRLFGPTQATAASVLREVMARRYDVLHFAGHCRFDPRDPANSGWLFTGGEVLDARMLERIDRVPKFIFSNACESGVTPDRPAGYSIDLAPSFAAAFFARGVADFVCTAWPIDDFAARRFARRLYAGLLGLEPVRRRGGRTLFRRVRPKSMYQAMLAARLELAELDRLSNPGGARTWGAYQHYGDPNFRLFSSR